MNRLRNVDNTVELWISPKLEHLFREIFEIEILQGHREETEGGDIYFRFETSTEKIEKLKIILLQYISSSNDIIFN